MKTLNAKRIAAVVAGAALLGVGLAFAGSITFQNVPIISNSGQPVVQVVVGSNAKPWDGVTAANIAAAIGNLAYTSVPVTATVNGTQATSVLHVAVSSSSYSLTNQQVWLNESGVTSATGGTYLFSALIGSVLNQGVELGSPTNTKALSNSGSYSFIRSTSTTNSPLSSPYTTATFVPASTSVTANNNGGGVSFNQFQYASGGPDDLLQVTSSQLNSLLNNYGGSGETEYLWLTGFPVFDQGSPGSLVNQFMLMDSGGAYQVIFNKPIQNRTGSNSIQLNVPIRLLGQNFTIINASVGTTVSGASTGTFKAGSNIYLASSVAPLQTLYVGHNITSGPWTVQLTDLGQPNNAGTSPASVSVLYNNVLTNTSSTFPHNITKFNVSGHTLYVSINQTFAGLYAYQKWAKLQLYTNVYQLVNNHVFNTTTNPGWTVDLLWTNTSSGTKDNALYSIVIYNSSTTNLAPGQSFNFIQNPQAYKVTFLGDTLGSSSFDALNIVSSTQSTVQYQNTGAASTNGWSVPTNITEPAQELTVTSQIPNAFSYAGQTSSSVTYDLTPYQLNTPANIVTPTATNVILVYNNPQAGVQTPFGAVHSSSKWVNSTYPLSVTITGAATPGGSLVTQNIQFSNAIIGQQAANTLTNTLSLSTALYNVSSIQIQGNRALPVGSGGSLTINVVSSNALYLGSNNIQNGNSLNTLGQLVSVTPGQLYTQTRQVYLGFSNSANAIYNQQNGQLTSAASVALVVAGTAVNGGTNEYGIFQINEYPVPQSSTYNDIFGIGLFNSTSGTSATPLYIVNYSTQAKGNNVSYTSTAGTVLNVQAGFRSEKGSKVASISPTQDVLDMATAVDQLQFAVQPNTANAVTRSSHLFGPYRVGQATNLPNVSIGNVTGTPVLTGTSSYTITGISNLTATPSVSSATQPVLLRNLTTTPLVVLDSQANSGSNLILVGSGFVNTLSQQLQSAYNISITPTTELAQAYGTNRVLIAGYYANQTNAAGNSFIQQLYAQVP